MTKTISLLIFFGLIVAGCQNRVPPPEYGEEYYRQKDSLVVLANKFLIEGTYDSLELACTELEYLSKSVLDKEGIIVADYFRAYSHYYQENYFSSELLLRKHEKNFQHLAKNQFKANTTKLFGNILIERGNYLEAKRYLEESLFIKSEVGDSSFLYQLYLDLAYVDYKLNRELNAATELFERALKIVESYTQVEPRSYVLVNFAVTIKQEHPEEALRYINQAFELEEEVAPNLYFEKASIMRNLKRYSEALELLEVCGKMAADQGFELGVLKVNYLQAEIYYLQGNCNRGLQVIQASEPLMKNFKTDEVDFLLEMKNDLLICLNQIKEAVALQSEIIELKDKQIKNSSISAQKFIDELVLKFKVEDEYNLLEADLQAKKRESILKNIIIGILVIVFLVVLLLWIQNRKLYRSLENSFEKLVERYHLDLEAIKDSSSKIDTESTQLFNQIVEYFEKEHPFLDPNFKTETVSSKFEISYAKLKDVLYDNIKESSFSNFVNTYRVNYAKKILADPEKNHYSIEGIALESGFGTRQTFYKVFEQQTGLKPNYFRENIQKKKFVS